MMCLEGEESPSLQPPLAFSATLSPKGLCPLKPPGVNYLKLSGESVLNERRRMMLASFYDRVTPRTPKASKGIDSCVSLRCAADLLP